MNSLLPIRGASLSAFCETMQAPCTTGIGLNVVHNLRLEDALVPERPFLDQRGHVQFVSPMCKPLVIRDRVAWGAGFHSSNYPIEFSGLYLFHLRWIDLGESLKRLAITRKITFQNPGHGAHQRLPNIDYVNYFMNYANMSINSESDFLFSEYTDVIARDQGPVRGDKIGFNGDLRSKMLFQIPAEFNGLF